MMMHFLQLLSTLVALIVFNQGDCMKDGIVGGHVAAPHSRPFMVFILYKVEKNVWKQCDGFLVREDFVMTAAHCKGKDFYVFPGLHDRTKPKPELRVQAKPYAHPNYTHSQIGINDIMLLKLQEKVILSESVQLIALPETENDALSTTNCLIPGWGAMGYVNTTASDLLREVNVTVGVFLNCETPEVLCTRANKGPFEGDSGGPLICGEVACGVVSTCRKDGHTHIHYYARIAYYRHWIDKIMSTVH